jgi:hypothetical protein
MPARRQYKLSPLQEALLEFCRKNDALMKPSIALKRTVYGLLLEYGWWYEYDLLPEGIQYGKPQQCFDNAYDLMADRKDLIYCEGFAILGRSYKPAHHAWVTDGTGVAIDPTWRTGGVVYAGIPIKAFYAMATTVRNQPEKGFLNDWLNKYPLLGELGDRPTEWLEPKGKGVALLLGKAARRKP